MKKEKIDFLKNFKIIKARILPVTNSIIQRVGYAKKL